MNEASSGCQEKTWQLSPIFARVLQFIFWQLALSRKEEVVTICGQDPIPQISTDRDNSMGHVLLAFNFLKIVSCKIFQKLAELIYTHLCACCWYLTDVSVLSGALDVLQIICADIPRPRTILSPYSFTLHLKWRVQKLDSCTSKTSSVFRKLSVDLCLQNRLVGGLDSKTSQPVRPSQIFECAMSGGSLSSCFSLHTIFGWTFPHKSPDMYGILQSSFVGNTKD